MGLAAGIGAQIGFAKESTYGTLVTVDHFPEFISESVKTDVASVVSQGLSQGRYPKLGRHKEYVRGVGGPVEFDYLTRGFGILLEAMLGGYANALVVGSERKATITPDAVGLVGRMLTCQVGRPSSDGTVQPWTFGGVKIKSWEFSIAEDDKLKLKLELDGKSVTTATGLAAATYPANANIMVWSEGAATINGASVNLKSFSVKQDTGLWLARRVLGNTKKEPLPMGIAPITGQLEFLEYEDNTRYASFIAGTELVNLVITFTTATIIAGGGPEKLIMTFPLIKYTGDTPVVDGPAVLKNPVPFMVLNDGVNPYCTLEQRTLDTVV